MKDWAAVASRRVSSSAFFYVPLIFPRRDLKQVQRQTSSVRSQGDVIYTFPESSGLDDHEGPDTAVRHLYVTTAAQPSHLLSTPGPAPSRPNCKTTGPGSRAMLSALEARRHRTLRRGAPRERTHDFAKLNALSSGPAVMGPLIPAHRKIATSPAWRWKGLRDRA